MRATLLLALAWLAPVSVLAQLSGRVGPKVDFRTKAKTKTCDITDYGAKDGSKSDVGQAIVRAWQDCSNGGLVYIPPGTYTLKADITLKKGNSSAIQLDGVIERGYHSGYQMILVRDCDDFEFFSGNSKGAIQGHGHEYLKDGKYGVRLMRFQNLRDFSVHGFAAIDSPSYYFVFDKVKNGEIYNLIARGVTQLGMTDRFDIWARTSGCTTSRLPTETSVSRSSPGRATS
jgi:rhamnogalacturonan hydrolase